MSELAPGETWTLNLTGLGKRFGPDVLFEGLDLRIEPGSAIRLLGPNGSGKTQFLLALAGLATLDEGSVRFDVQGRQEIVRRDPYGIDHWLRYIPGSLDSLASLPVGELVLALSRGLRPFGIGSRQKAVGSYFGAVQRRHLEQLVGDALSASLRVSILSIGQQRRLTVGAVAASLRRPRVLLVDEPLAGLDGEGIRRVLEVLTSVRQGGVALVVAEHRSEVEALGFDTEVIMPYRRDRGGTAADGGPAASVSSDASPSPEPRLAISSARAGYPGAAVRCEELFLGPGEVALLTGPNGSGKTGFLRALVGQAPARFEGDLRLEGRPMAHLAEAIETGAVRYMSQDRRTFPDIPAQDALRAAVLRGHPIPPELMEIVAKIGRHKLVRHLSAGSRALLCLAQTLASKPRLALLDEPFANVDAANRAWMMTLMAEARRWWGTSFLLVEHAPAAAPPDARRYHLQLEAQGPLLSPLATGQPI